MKYPRYKELDDICNEMQKLITREVQETLERHCDLEVYYFFSHDIFSCEVDVNYYGVTIGTGHTIPAKDLRNATDDELREICVDCADTLCTYVKESMKRCGNEKDKV